jgi:hypothetical protein
MLAISLSFLRRPVQREVHASSLTLPFHIGAFLQNTSALRVSLVGAPVFFSLIFTNTVLPAVPCKISDIPEVDAIVLSVRILSQIAPKHVC